jgi:hypothetical protein
MPRVISEIMRIFFDTEFTDFVDRDLISIGLVVEDGREFYAERNDIDLPKCSLFVRSIVLPQLGKIPAFIGTTAEICTALKKWLSTIDEAMEMCADHVFDWEVLGVLLGTSQSQELSSNLTWRNIRGQVSDIDLAAYRATHNCGEHHALHDARALKFAFEKSAHSPAMVFFDVISEKVRGEM